MIRSVLVACCLLVPAAALVGPTAADPIRVTVPLEELWRIGGDSEEEGEFFGVIGAIEVGADGTVFLLDRQLSEVKLFDADGGYIRTIGREGEGPGEFRRPTDLFLTPEGNVAVLQLMPGKIVALTPEGDPAGEIRLPELEGGGRRMLWQGAGSPSGIVVESSTMTMDGRSGTRSVTIAAYSPDGGTETARFFERSSPIDFANMVIDERTTMRPIWTIGDDGVLWLVPVFGEYRLQMILPDGTVEREIEREYEHLVRTEEEREEARGRFVIRGPRVQPTIKVLDHHPDIREIHARPDGGCWALTSRGWLEPPDGAICVFDVFDSEGEFVRQVVLQGEGDPEQDALYLTGDRLFVVTGFFDALRAMFGGGEEEEEVEPAADLVPMEVICYRLDS
ncbi:MAG: 6-bladed beta-propeller [Candidatus Eisenbacteria bacterium]|nr:6-bladed beta-propeller [Candidatus Latescibacterota bacterium]MBD3301281.1 6-bladed beta-propeller [Candidatus Eisenbacteria bacterium]